MGDNPLGSLFGLGVCVKADAKQHGIALEVVKLPQAKKGFVLAAKQASSLPTEGDLTQQRDFFIRLGSNWKIVNKQLVWEPRVRGKPLSRLVVLPITPATRRCFLVNPSNWCTSWGTRIRS
jgi:hypothetical protein